jgi:hypothetical protein
LDDSVFGEICLFFVTVNYFLFRLFYSPLLFDFLPYASEFYKKFFPAVMLSLKNKKLSLFKIKRKAQTVNKLLSARMYYGAGLVSSAVGGFAKGQRRRSLSRAK